MYSKKLCNTALLSFVVTFQKSMTLSKTTLSKMTVFKYSVPLTQYQRYTHALLCVHIGTSEDCFQKFPFSIYHEL